MKAAKSPVGATLALLLTTCNVLFSQGTFVNLDFESATIIPDPASPYYPFAVAVSNALPGWTAYGGTFYPDDVFYDAVSLGAAAISIHDANSTKGVLEGSYTVYLQGSFPGGQIVPALGQVGTVPSTARSILYFAAQASFTVTFAGQPIPVTAVGSGPNYTVFGGDVSAFANETGELKFQGCGLLDNIFFSNQSVPEPTVFGLLALGMVALGLSRSRRRT